MPRPRILFSSRDPGGAGHVAALVEAFRDHGGFDVELAASGVALRMLRDAGESVREFVLPDGRDSVRKGEAVGDLLATARDLLAATMPDAILGSLSTLGIGVDEALVAAAGCPTFVMQDFWGDVNLGLGKPATLYLALDEYAVQLTRERWDLAAAAIGSPKHTRYARLDVPAMRAGARAKVGATGTDRVAGFFAQSPEIAGHDAALEEFLRAAATLNPQPLFLLRSHPKFRAGAENHMRMAAHYGLRAVDVSGGEAEPWLAACDVVATPFSASGVDHAYLSAYSPAPLGTVVYTLPSAEIQQSMRAFCGLTELPTVGHGLGRVARTPAALAVLLAEGLSAAAAVEYFEASRALRQQDPHGRAIALVESRLHCAHGIPPA